MDRIESHVENVLYYSRSDSFSMDYLINEIDMEKVIREVVKKHAKMFIDNFLGGSEA